MTARGRWIAIASSAIALSAYWLTIVSGFFTARSTAALNDILWTIAGAIAGIVCFVTASKLRENERLAWNLIATGCVFWMVGQLVWDYYDLAVGVLPTFPHWMQFFFTAFPLLLVGGLMAL